MPGKQTNRQRVNQADVPADYPWLLANIKQRIRMAQVRAAFSVNAELIRLYWDIGRAIAQRQQRRGRGSGVIPRLARDLRNELPEVTGFSERNLKYMVRFYRECDAAPIVQQVAAQLPPAQGLPSASEVSPPPVAKSADASPLSLVQQLAAQLPWFHHVLLMEKVRHLPTRVWYMQQTILNGWSRNTLSLQIAACAHEHAGRGELKVSGASSAGVCESESAPGVDPAHDSYYAASESRLNRVGVRVSMWSMKRRIYTDTSVIGGCLDFDAVKTMRKIRDSLSRRFKGMTFEEQKRAMRAAQKPKPARSGTRAGAKRTA